MKRRDFLKSAAALPFLSLDGPEGPAQSADPRALSRRVRPGDPAWPSAALW